MAPHSTPRHVDAPSLPWKLLAPTAWTCAHFFATPTHWPVYAVSLRRKRGSIDFDTPEVHVLLDEAGIPVDLVTRERTASTSLVEEAMLLANECVAEFLADRDLVSAYRVHEDPSPTAWPRQPKRSRSSGPWRAGSLRASCSATLRSINAAVEDVAGTAFAPQVNALLLRAQQRAVYKSHNEGHYALGARAYVISPVRFADTPI